MTSETAEAKKGTWKGRGRCIPGQRHKEEAKPGASPTFLRVKGAGVCTSSPLVSQPIQGIGRERENYWVIKGETGQQDASLKSSDSFRLTDSCTFLLATPSGSSPQKIAFCSSSPQRSSLTCSLFYSILQMTRPS